MDAFSFRSVADRLREYTLEVCKRPDDRIFRFPKKVPGRSLPKPGNGWVSNCVPKIFMKDAGMVGRYTITESMSSLQFALDRLAGEFPLRFDDE